jgi:hypothetical protein
LFFSSPISRALASDTFRSFESFSDIDVRRFSLCVSGVLPDVIPGGTSIASFSHATRSAVPILDLARDEGGLRNHSPPFSKFLILEGTTCFTIDDHRADVRQNREAIKLRADKGASTGGAGRRARAARRRRRRGR